MFCECGCGGLAPIARQSDTAKGWKKGQSLRFIVGHNQKKKERPYGYTLRYRPDHPRASKSGDVYEHVLVAEAALGHLLPEGSEVHHVDENKMNNANRNLVICQDHDYHSLLHVRARVVRAGGNPNSERICSTCRRVRPFEAFNRMSSNKNCGLQKQCKECAREVRRLRGNRVAA